MDTQFGYQSKMLVLIVVLLIILSSPFLEIVGVPHTEIGENGVVFIKHQCKFPRQESTHVEDPTGISKTMYRLRALGWSTICTNRDAPNGKTGIAPRLAFKIGIG